MDHTCIFALLLLSASASLALAKTDQPDVSALNVMFTSMNSPSQLNGWESGGGDPCGDDWQGITCSGSSVTEINLSGLGLSGTLGYQLSSLTSVTKFDVSKCNLNGDIPYQLPPNVVELNLAQNQFSGTIPYSISQMSDLESLNLANNKLNGQLTDMFGKLPKLSMMDLSNNQLSGSLPQSFQSLKSLKSLYLQNNRFTGHIDVLAKLSLEDLNIENNKFTGWIPKKVANIGNLETGGNSWSSGNPPPGMDEDSNSGGSDSRGRGSGSIMAIAGIVIGVLAAAVILLSLLKRRSSSPTHYLDEKDSSAIDVIALEASTHMVPAFAPPEPRKWLNTNDFGSKSQSKRSTRPIIVKPFSLSDLQVATACFSSSYLVGQGTIGQVFKADFPDGNVLAVKKIDTLSNRTSDDFMDIVSDITKLHHQNISEFLGYCSEPGYHILVYEFQSNGSLHNFLHLSDDYSRPLTWDTRIRIALGAARALEYLHEVCSPPVVHKNIKSSNILLDSELNPRLADCGLGTFFQYTNCCTRIQVRTWERVTMHLNV